MLTNGLDSDKLIHSLKTALACILGFTVTQLLHVPTSPWVVITILIVMGAQIYVGSVIKKAYTRFLGTLIGCLFAISILILGNPSPFVIAITLAVSSFIFIYFAISKENLSYAGTLGAVTTVIILMSTTPTISTAAERFLEINIGIFIASITSQFVFPIHASTYLGRSQLTTLRQLRDYYIALIVKQQTDIASEEERQLDETLVQSFYQQRSLAKEAAREPLSKGFDSEHFMQSLLIEKEILRIIWLMHYGLNRHTKINAFISELKVFHDLNQHIEKSFNAIIKAKEQNAPLPPLTLLSTKALEEKIIENRDHFTTDEMVYVGSYLFTVNELVNALKRLASLYQVWTSSP